MEPSRKTSPHLLCVPQNGVTAVYMAAKCGHTEILAILLDAGANFHLGLVKVSPASPRPSCRVTIDACRPTAQENGKTKTPLFASSQNGHAEAVRMLIAAGADVNEMLSNKNTGTPLLVAAHYGHNDVIRLLIDAGANLDQGTEVARLPLLAPANLSRTLTLRPRPALTVPQCPTRYTHQCIKRRFAATLTRFECSWRRVPTRTVESG